MLQFPDPPRRARPVLWTMLWLAVAGCSTPLPPYTPKPLPPLPPLQLPPTPGTAVPPAVAPPGPAASQPGSDPRVPPPPAPAQPSPVTLVPDGPPYSDAVAARFPDPPVQYRTPAFESGRGAFTSNAELAALLRALVRDGRLAPGGTTVRLLTVGNSQAGVPLEALLFTRNPDAAPAAVLRAGRPTVLLVAQQHGDEPAGCEALLAIAQDLARGALEPLLDQINVVVLPRANPDGAQAGKRVTASGIDTNRDHLLLRTPEAQALSALVRDFRPMVVVDAHEYMVTGRFLEKFGALPRFDALVQYATVANLPEFITKAAEEWFRRPLVASLNKQGLTSEWYHTTSNDVADRKVSMGGTRPDTGRNVNGLRNAISLLVETRGGGIGRLHLARRVHTHVVAIHSVLNSTAQRAADLTKLRRFVDSEVQAQACQGQAIVAATPTSSEYTLTMLDPATGADQRRTVAWDSALVLDVRKARVRPCGYWLGGEQIDAVLRLRGLGVTVQQVQQNSVARGESYTETSRKVGTGSDGNGSVADAGGVLQVEVDTLPALIDAAAGSYYVSLEQPLANLAVSALEPDTPYSYVAHRVVTAVTGVARVMVRPDWRMVTMP
jgi:Zinc carboxypeptidase